MQHHGTAGAFCEVDLASRPIGHNSRRDLSVFDERDVDSVERESRGVVFSAAQRIDKPYPSVRGQRLTAFLTHELDVR